MRGSSRDFLKIGLVALGILIVVGYAYLKTKNLVQGPVITILSPADGTTVEHASVELAGTTKNISKISVNGRTISIDESGKFYDVLVVPEGYTIISVEGIDRFGKKKEVAVRVVRKKQDTETATTTVTAMSH